MTSSLRSRIALGTTVATALVVLVAAVCVWFAAQALLLSTVDTKLQNRARNYHRLGVVIPGRLAHEPPVIISGEFLMEVLSLKRVELHRSPTLTSGESLSPILDATTQAEEIVSLRIGERPVRGMWLRTAARAGHDHEPDEAPAGPALPAGDVLTLQAYDMTASYSELSRLAWLLGSVWVGAVLLSGLVSVWLCRAMLRPVDRLSLVIQGIEPGSLRGAIADDLVPPEMQPLVARLNELFARVEDAIAREKATIASIAHELRTPIAGLRTTLEFALARASEPPVRQVQERCLGMVVQMQAMVTNLLTLARLEAGQEQLALEPVELIGLIQACWEPSEMLAESRRLAVQWHLPERATITSAREQLRIVIGNIIDNAVRYTPVGGEISIGCSVDAEGLAIELVNATDGSLADASRVFEPFWRGDQARSGGTHCGLGLALVQRLVRCLGGSATAEATASPPRFRIRVRLPGPARAASAA